LAQTTPLDVLLLPELAKVVIAGDLLRRVISSRPRGRVTHWSARAFQSSRSRTSARRFARSTLSRIDRQDRCDPRARREHGGPCENRPGNTSL